MPKRDSGWILQCYVWAVFAAAVLHGVWLHVR